MRRGEFTIKYPADCPFRGDIVCGVYDPKTNTMSHMVRHVCKKDDILCTNIATFPKLCQLKVVEEEAEE